ncbi:MAG TPA: hypothetical protein GXX40_06540 [Firmicutes bacterium]|nr:hypothetical protein [Bacillota bacterium]
MLEHEKSQQFLMALSLTLGDLTGNSTLRRVLCAKSDIDLDSHLEQGGVLAVNTAMGPLGRLGHAFGQFFILHFQQAVFRRPSTERTRTTHNAVRGRPKIHEPQLREAACDRTVVQVRRRACAADSSAG